MNLELRLLMALSRRLPRARGAWRVAVALENFYTRKARPSVIASVNQYKMTLDPAELVDRHLLFAPQLYEWRGVKALRRRVKPGDVFLDAGANIGFFTFLMAPRAGRVLAVEADPRNCERIRQTLSANAVRNVTICPVAVSSRRERLTLGLNLHGDRGAQSFLMAHDAELKVDCLPLLDLLREMGVERLDAAKFDIEGFEYRVLKPFLETAPEPLIPKTILIEQNDLAEGDAVGLLRQRGFHITPLTAWDYLAERG